MRFLGFDLGAPTPDENTIRHFRNRLTETGTLQRVMKAFDWELHKRGYIPMSGQIVDASLVPAPKQRNTEDEKVAIKAGKSAADDRGAGVRQYISHISIDRRFGFIREATATSASGADGRQLKHVVSREKTGSDVWADSAYRSQRNEKWLASRMLTSRIHRRKPAGKSNHIATARANAKKSSVRAAVDHVFAHQKNRFGLFIRTIGLTRAEAKLTLANLA